MTSTKPTEIAPQRVGIASGAFIRRQTVTRLGEVCQAPAQKVEARQTAQEPEITSHYHRCSRCGIILDCSGDYCQEPIECRTCCAGKPY
jgi:hypothetical protein